MTDSKKKTSLDTFLPLASSIFACILLLAFPKVVSEGVRGGLSLCYRAIIPAVFPFAVLAELLSQTDLSPIDKTLGRLIARPLGLTPIGGRVVLLGMLFGFPIGAKMSASLYRDGRIRKNEAERLLFAASLPSPAFLISGVGGSMLGNVSHGLRLYAAVLLSWLLVAALLPRGREEENSAVIEPTSRPLSLSEAISGAAMTALNVTATVTLFSMLSALGAHLIRYTLPAALLSAILEIGSGCSTAAKLLGGTRTGNALLGFCAAFSGLSVALQVRAVTIGGDLSARLYLPAKLAAGILCALLSFVFFG